MSETTLKHERQIERLSHEIERLQSAIDDLLFRTVKLEAMVPAPALQVSGFPSKPIQLSAVAADVDELKELVAKLMHFSAPAERESLAGMLRPRNPDPPVFTIRHIAYGKFKIVDPNGDDVPGELVSGKAEAEKKARQLAIAAINASAAPAA